MRCTVLFQHKFCPFPHLKIVELHAHFTTSIGKHLQVFFLYMAPHLAPVRSAPLLSGLLHLCALGDFFIMSHALTS